MTKAQKQLGGYIKRKLVEDDRWARRGLLVIYERQTADEKTGGVTVHHNTVGFSGVDAEILTSFAKQLKTRKFLTDKQMVILKRKIIKYWRQLLEASDRNKLEGLIAKESI